MATGLDILSNPPLSSQACKDCKLERQRQRDKRRAQREREQSQLQQQQKPPTSPQRPSARRQSDLSTTIYGFCDESESGRK